MNSLLLPRAWNHHPFTIANLWVHSKERIIFILREWINLKQQWQLCCRLRTLWRRWLRNNSQYFCKSSRQTEIQIQIQIQIELYQEEDCATISIFSQVFKANTNTNTNTNTNSNRILSRRGLPNNFNYYLASLQGKYKYKYKYRYKYKYKQKYK